MCFFPGKKFTHSRGTHPWCQTYFQLHKKHNLAKKLIQFPLKWDARCSPMGLVRDSFCSLSWVLLSLYITILPVAQLLSPLKNPLGFIGILHSDSSFLPEPKASCSSHPVIWKLLPISPPEILALQPLWQLKVLIPFKVLSTQNQGKDFAWGMTLPDALW